MVSVLACFLIGLHISIVMISIIIIIFTSSVQILWIMLLLNIILYISNWYYKDCFLSIIESKYSNVITIDLYGKLIPRYKPDAENRSIVGTTSILAAIFCCILRLIKNYIF